MPTTEELMDIVSSIGNCDDCGEVMPLTPHSGHRSGQIVHLCYLCRRRAELVAAGHKAPALHHRRDDLGAIGAAAAILCAILAALAIASL